MPAVFITSVRIHCDNGSLLCIDSDTSSDNDELVIGDCVANYALQVKVTSKKQRRRSFVVGPATPKSIEFRHVATDVFDTQLQVVVPQPLFSLLHCLRQFCATKISTKSAISQGWKKPRFFKRNFLGFLGFLGFFCTKTEHDKRKYDPKAHEKEKHPIHHGTPFPFSRITAYKITSIM